MSELLISSSKPQTRLCQNLQDPPLGRSTWNKLLQSSETRSIFLTWQWLSTWWECFSEGAELYVFVVLRDAELIGIAPLMLRREEGVRIIEFLGMGSSDYCDFIASEDDKAEVVVAVIEALLRRRDRWDRVRLRYLPERSSTSRILSTIELPGDCELHSEIEAPCPALSIENSPPFAAACAKKKSLMRHTRYFERLSPLQFYHVLDPDEIADLLPEFFEQHRDRRFMAGDRSLFEDARHRRFYERVVRELLDVGWLRFSVLRWQDQILAFHFGFFYDQVITWYKPTFNVDYARYSPGEVLIKKLIEDSIATNAREIDFTVGDEGFKERFANVKRHNLRVQIIQQSKIPSQREFREHLQRFIKQRYPQMYARLKATVALLQQFRNSHEEETDTRQLAPGLRPLPRLGIVRRCLWRTAPVQPVPTEFRAQWARYSQIKAIARREGLKPSFLIASLARMHRGERAVVALWNERPIALLWLARDPASVLASAGFDATLPAGAALISDSYLAADVQVLPRRETLLPTLQTFLAAEGVTALYNVEDTREEVSLPVLCDAAIEPLVQRTELLLLFKRFGFTKQLSQNWEEAS